MATPNEEQQVSIEHSGGVLLKAGAGSGKTFVLKEHLIYLSRLEIETAQKKGLGLEEFKAQIKQKFKRTVLMTFTKKAAGELNIRLNREFSSLSESDPDNAPYWDVVFEQLSYLNVSTIHGFCFKLITLGLFPGVSGDQSILSSSEQKDKIWNLCSSHLESVLDQTDETLRDLVLKERKSIFQSVENIFSDPSLRYAWMNLDANDLKDNLNQVFKNIFREHGLVDLFEHKLELGASSEYSGKSWFDFLTTFKPLLDDFDYSLEKVIRLVQFLESVKFRIPNRPKAGKIDESLVDYYSDVAKLKDFLKSYSDDFHAFNADTSGVTKIWIEFILNLVKGVDANYSKTLGITFSDMEYLVYTNLLDSKIALLIQKEFDYIIVDEFQDTSYIQYSILESIVNGDLTKLFCVGDLKQAIYGFRGGELGVFIDCARKIPTNLSLKNNYRSTTDIIRFNNLFFEYLFKLGPKFEGSDPHTVEVEPQASPPSMKELGHIGKLVVEAPQRDEKFSNLQTDYLESLAISAKISELQHSGENCAVLYKKLKPSLILINLLMDKGVGFSAQVKIPFLEDPILGIFLAFLEKDLNVSESQDDYQVLLIQSYFKLLGFKIDLKLFNLEFAKFESERKFYGLYQSFFNFLFRVGLRTSHFSNNLTFIKTLIDVKGDSVSTLYKILSEQKENSYSMEFEYGANSEKVKIMSAHASKGLQFENVILGGIFTNDKSMPLTSLVGKMPFSFKWVDSIYGKNKFKTPHYILEEVLTKNKDFSENKRLFYVACTRAEKGLFWTEINWGDSKRTTSGSNSWSNALSKWCHDQSLVEISEKSYEVENSYKDEFSQELENKPPFFHIDSLGITSISPNSKLFLLGEISVTKLALITGCPRQFYFENICKISQDEINYLVDEKKFESVVVPVESDVLSSKSFLKSSAARGSEVHDYLSRLILSDFGEIASPISSLDQVVDNLKGLRDKFDLISERPIKFELMGYMISGIPDLILRPKDESDQLEVWDFKTGHYSEDKLSPYYFQLMVYAYACYISGVLKPSSKCKLLLYFVDENKKVEYTVQLRDVEKYLTKELQKINTPEVKNLELCSNCKFEAICDK